MLHMDLNFYTRFALCQPSHESVVSYKLELGYRVRVTQIHNPKWFLNNHRLEASSYIRSGVTELATFTSSYTYCFFQTQIFRMR